MPDSETKPNPKAQKYDALRKIIPAITKPNVLALTSGIYAKFNDSQVADIMQRVKDYDDFKVENDPYREHDFGSFEYNCIKIFWKIEDYAGTDGIELLLTVLLADEY